MKRASIVVSLVLIAGLCVSSEAFACGRRCANVAPPGSLPCLRCIADPASPGNCENYGSACGCFWVPCYDFSKALLEEDSVLATIFSDDMQTVGCSTLPLEIIEPAGM